jgi:hypothetical protein
MKQRIGIVMIWIGILGLLFNYIYMWISSPIYRVNTAEELTGTIWASDAFLFMFNGVWTFIGFGCSIIGILLYSGRKDSLFWLWGFVPFIAFGILTTWLPSQSLAPLFGIFGGVITLSYFGVLWGSVKSYTSYEGAAKTGKQVQLIGYSFLYITALFLCMNMGTPKLPGLANVSIVSGLSIIIAFAIGFALLPIGDYLIGKKANKDS